MAEHVSCSLVLHEAGGYIPSLPGPKTGRYIAKIAAGGNQGNWTRNRQIISEIYRVGVTVARKPLSGRPSKRNGLCNGTDRGTERNGTDRFTPFLGKRCRRATQMKRTGFRKFLGHGLYI